MHSLVRSRCIESRSLPLEASRDSSYIEFSTRGTPTFIRTELPRSIQSALEIDPAIELICVEGEGRRQSKNPDERKVLPRLLLYTRKNAFLLQLAYSDDDDGDVVQGHVASVEEPLDHYLEVSTATSILRGRPAPQSSEGYATICPAACFAVLTENLETFQYSLLLYHGNGSITEPLYFGIEDDAEGTERFSDFCFAQSDGLSLFASLSVLLLKESGDVLAASPVVFDGTVVSKSHVDDGLDYLQDQLDRSSDSNSAKWRLCKAAAQFLTDAFLRSENQGQYCTARVLYQADQSATKWPIALQGPILSQREVDACPAAVAIENFGSSDCLVGVAIGKVAGKVDLAGISPTSLLPRFAFESDGDSRDLDDALIKLGSLLERVELCPVSTGINEESNISIVKDPVVDNLLHYATPAAVFTISSQAMRSATRKVKGQHFDPARTTAWICLRSVDALQGIIVSPYAALGHTLVVGLKRGSMISIDVTESKSLHEFDSLLQNVASSDEWLLLKDNPADSSTPPLYDAIKTLSARINAGLSNMGRLVGSETGYSKISPDALAVAIKIKMRSDDEVALPLLELRKTVEKYRSGLKSTLEQQQKQLKSIVYSVKDLQARITATSEQMEEIETNASSLSQRSSAALETSQRMLPTITQAEFDYFQAIKRLNLKCAQMEHDIQHVNEVGRPQFDALDESLVAAAVKNVDEDSIKHANALLLYEGVLLTQIQERIAKTESLSQQLASEHGIVI